MQSVKPGRKGNKESRPWSDGTASLAEKSSLVSVFGVWGLGFFGALLSPSSRIRALARFYSPGLAGRAGADGPLCTPAPPGRRYSLLCKVTAGGGWGDTLSLTPSLSQRGKAEL